ncbi:MAG: ATP-binding protein [Burkholderiales bacterium]
MRRTLFSKYAVHLGALVCSLLVVSGAVAGYFSYRESIAALEQVQRAEVRFAATEIDTFVHRAQEALASIVTKFGAAPDLSPEDLRLELTALLRHHPEITEARWIAPDGRERFVLARLGANALSDRDWAEDESFRRARAASAYVGPVYFRKETEPYVTLAAAADARGSVLAAEVDLKHVRDVLSRLAPGSRNTTYVVDAKGRLISHPDITLVLANTDLSALPQVRDAMRAANRDVAPTRPAHDVDAVRVVSTASPIEHLGWTVFAEQPLEQALGPVYASIYRSMALVAVGLLAAIGASLLLARRMARPIHEIETRARQLGAGDYAHRIDLRTGDELEALATQFNRMAAQLQETHAMQEQRIAERTRELALANDAKTRFLAAASHDLRQPIHALSLFVGQLRTLRLPADAQPILERTDHSLEALRELLEALLDLSRLDLGAITPAPQPFALDNLLARLAAQFAPLAEAKGLALSYLPTSLWVRSDPVLVERIVQNLMSNALRYTVEGRILLGCRRRGADVELVVADTGVGIERSQLPRIFDEFYRADAGRGMAPGLGLGLAIVKRLSLLLGHRLVVDSAEGRGTIARLSVPRAPPQVVAAWPPESLTDNLRDVRVLVVDDEPAAREAVEGLLRQWGCEVFSTATGDEAVARARQWPADIALCDLNLARAECGIEVARRIEEACVGNIACAFVTAESSPERLAAARATGRPVASKPLSPAKLRALIEHMLATHRREQHSIAVTR